jgi:D-3-phosphoglycerate dehydrogenase
LTKEADYRILVADKLGQLGVERLQAAPDASADVKTGMSREELLAVIGEYDALIVRSATTVDAEVLVAATSLRVVGRAGIGVDNIDVRAATARGVLVTNTPQASTVSTAEHAMALMLAASRNLVAAHQSVKAGKWKGGQRSGIQLQGKTLGLVGFGRVGRLVAARARAFGMEVLATDPYVSDAVAQEAGVTLVDLDDLFAAADYVSLHTPNSPETRQMINAATIAKMKDGVVIINAARGALIDETALSAALATGKVRAAAVDVYSKEPVAADNPLLDADNIVLTPHLGASTREAEGDVAVQIVDQVLDALRGVDFRNAINLPFAPGQDLGETLPYVALAEKLGALQFAMALGPVRRVEVEVRGEHADQLVRPVAAGLLKGLLDGFLAARVTYVSAPVLAEEHGITIAQSSGMSRLDYPNLISCRVHWDGGQRLVSGVLFAGGQPRVVQVDDYQMDTKPEGVVLLMINTDVPGVIGQVGTLLGTCGVNIAEWRLGRNEAGTEAMSFVNLDTRPSDEVLEAIRKVSAVRKAVVAEL